MMLKLFNCLLVAAWSCAVAVAANSCSITLPTDIKGFAPILLTRPSVSSAYQLFKPTGQTTQLPQGSSLLLTCTGNNNIIVSLNTASLELECDASGSFVDSNNNVHLLQDIVCKSIPSSTLKLTTVPCSLNRGVVFEAGFTVAGQFYGPVFEICYDSVTETTFYTHNIINGAAIDYSISESTRRAFTADGLKLSTTKVNNYYTQKNQKQRFEAYFGAGQTYIQGNNYLARGHLSPDADFIFGYEQLSTYYYANVAPEYQPVNAGNWLRVEELARAVAASYGTDVETYNGYMDILELPKANGDLVEIYLDDDHEFEAPKYYFKVLLERASDEAIVFVSVNNLYINDGPAEEICENVCDTADLKHANFPDVTKGYTFCCRLDDFRSYYDGLPADVVASKLMTKQY